MRIAVATAEGGGPFDGVFWSSYVEAGGPRPVSVLLLRDTHARSVPRKLLESFLLFRPGEVLRLSSAQLLGRPLRGVDRRLSLHKGVEGLLPGDGMHCVRSLNSQRGRSLLTEAEADYLVSVGSPEIFDRDVLSIPRRAALNLHNGRLPDYRGMFGTFWELYHGEARGWVTLHEMVPEVDAGPIRAEQSVSLDEGLFTALIEKKKVGGRMLARFLGGDTLGASLSQADRSADHGYYGWPTLGEMWSLARRR